MHRIQTLVLTLTLAAFPSILAAEETIIFRAQAPEIRQGWRTVNDDVMGGISTSSFVEGKDFALFRGVVSLENNGGFASVRMPVRDIGLMNEDYFLIRVRGDGQRYKFTVKMMSTLGWLAPSYQCSFDTRAGRWEELRLPFSRFSPTFRGRVLRDQPPIDPSRIRSIGLMISDKQAGPFRLNIEEIKTGVSGPDSPRIAEAAR